MIRTFLAIEIPEDIRRKIYENFARLHRQSPAVKWVEAEHMHLSLRFIGDLDESILEQEVIPALEKLNSEFKPLELNVKGVGLFPNSEKPRIFWLGIGGTLPDLKRLQFKIEKTLQAWPVHAEENDFHPHITLGRIKQTVDRKMWQEALEEYEKMDFGSFRASTFKLIKSELTPHGPIYTPLHEFHLKT